MPDKNEKKIAAIVMAMLVALYLLGIAGGIAALAGLLGPLEGRAAVPFLLTFLLSPTTPSSTRCLPGRNSRPGRSAGGASGPSGGKTPCLL